MADVPNGKETMPRVLTVCNYCGNAVNARINCSWDYAKECLVRALRQVEYQAKKRIRKVDRTPDKKN